MRRSIGHFIQGLLAGCVLVTCGAARAQLRVVDYNTAGLATGPRPEVATVMKAIGDEQVNGITKAPDVIALQEQRRSGTTTAGIVAQLNNIYGEGTYAAADSLPISDSTGVPALIYNTETVEYIDWTTASTVSSSGAARATIRYELRPLGYDSSAEFYVYSSHYKSSDTTADRNRRGVEAAQVRANADALGQGAHIIYAGDFNVYSSSEAMFGTLTAAGNGQAFDPLRNGQPYNPSQVENWHDNSAYLAEHTQAPSTTEGVGGGVDDRFDWQLVTGEFMDNEGLSYITGSYHAFGNTGTHQLSGNISTGSPAALRARLPGYTTAQAAAVLSALETASDHLPVVADYQLPAKMSVTGVSSPSLMIVGADAKARFTVSNSAPVGTVNGADELDYNFSGSGGLRGGGTGTDNALGAGNMHEIGLDADAAGNHTGTLSVVSSSQGAANPNFSQGLNYTVLDHAQASFSSLDVMDSSSRGFGMLELASGPVEMQLTLSNILTTSGFTAGLDLDGISLSGDSEYFELSLATFDGLDAGDSVDFTATFLGASAGTYTATYTFAFSDEDLPGAADLGSLSLTLSATVVPEPSTAVLFAAAASLFGLHRTRRRLN